MMVGELDPATGTLYLEVQSGDSFSVLVLEA